MNDSRPLPKIGDRVQFADGDEVFVVVEVDEETESASLIPEGHVETVAIDEITPIAQDEQASGTGSLSNQQVVRSK